MNELIEWMHLGDHGTEPHHRRGECGMGRHDRLAPVSPPLANPQDAPSNSSPGHAATSCRVRGVLTKRSRRLARQL